MNCRALTVMMFVTAVAVAVAVAVTGISPTALAGDEAIVRTVGKIRKMRAPIGQTVRFHVKTSSGKQEAEPITASALPSGATFYDNGDGTATFEWTPSANQAGEHVIEITDPTTGATESVMMPAGGIPLSHGFYRLGYGPGVNVNVAQDHLTHNPVTKLDLNAIGGGPGNFIPIIAAADGRIRDIVNGNSNCCTGCSECNNHVWIEHANGEFTKYTHFLRNSVTVTFGHFEGECVQAGDTLGWEGDIGATSGSGAPQRKQNTCPGDANPVDTTKFCFYHLHFEVDANGINTDLRIPLICEAPSNNVCQQTEDIIAATCGGAAACATDVNLPAQAFGGSTISVRKADNSITSDDPFEVGGTASVAFFAGNRIRLMPGFAARTNAYFHAMILPCEGSLTGCPAP